MHCGQLWILEDQQLMSPVIANDHVLHRRPRNPSYACYSGLEVFVVGGMMKEASALQGREREQRAGL